jgi:Bifunctional DNA primase/polymerase, N-terminal
VSSSNNRQPSAPDELPPGKFDAAEACYIAQNIARNCGYAVFPCGEDKKPTRPKRDGGQGLKDATTDPEQIAALWRRWPGSLIGIATGERSGVSALDIDIKADAARAWWRQHEIRLPTTRTYRTRSGGLHLYFRHAPGVRNVSGKPILGVDVRGDGGYVIFWFGAGFECVDPAPIAPWPHWLTPFFWPPPKPKNERRSGGSAQGRTGAIAGLIRTVREAQELTRNSKLYWAAHRLRERAAAGEIGEAEAKRLLTDAARDCGLPIIEVERTIASAWSAS